MHSPCAPLSHAALLFPHWHSFVSHCWLGASFDRAPKALIKKAQCDSWT